MQNFVFFIAISYWPLAIGLLEMRKKLGNLAIVTSR
jgi:hypothetical protein